MRRLCNCLRKTFVYDGGEDLQNYDGVPEEVSACPFGIGDSP
jgi:hypothetical protein